MLLFQQQCSLWCAALCGSESFSAAAAIYVQVIYIQVIYASDLFVNYLSSTVAPRRRSKPQVRPCPTQWSSSDAPPLCLQAMLDYNDYGAALGGTPGAAVLTESWPEGLPARTPAPPQADDPWFLAAQQVRPGSGDPHVWPVAVVPYDTHTSQPGGGGAQGNHRGPLPLD